jgi:GTP cyclohydrolase I
MKNKVIKEQNKNLSKNTAKRVQLMKKIFSKMPKIKVFENTHNYDQMIVQVGIPVLALCEHHECSFEGVVHIAYLPEYWLVGLSKLARVAEYHLNPTVKTIQEKATANILKNLKDCLHPKGLMVVVEARHSCIAYRGVKKPSLTITSAVDGIFAEQGNDAKYEFLSFINRNNK